MRLDHLSLDHLSAYGISVKILIVRPTKRLVTDLSVPETTRNETSCPRNVRLWNINISLTISINNAIRKLSILLPYLSAYGICAKIILAHIAYVLRCTNFHNSARSWPRQNKFISLIIFWDVLEQDVMPSHATVPLSHLFFWRVTTSK